MVNARVNVAKDMVNLYTFIHVNLFMIDWKGHPGTPPPPSLYTPLALQQEIGSRLSHYNREAVITKHDIHVRYTKFDLDEGECSGYPCKILCSVMCVYWS